MVGVSVPIMLSVCDIEIVYSYKLCQLWKSKQEKAHMMIKGNHFLSLLLILECITMGHTQLFNLLWISLVILNHETAYMKKGRTCYSSLNFVYVYIQLLKFPIPGHAFF